MALSTNNILVVDIDLPTLNNMVMPNKVDPHTDNYKEQLLVSEYEFDSLTL